MRNGKGSLKYLLPVILLLTIPFVFSANILSVYEFVPCELNRDFLQKRLCNETHCFDKSGPVCEVGNCSVGDFRFLFNQEVWDRAVIESSGIQIMPNSSGNYEIDETVKKILNEICRENVTPVLDHIDKNVSGESCRYYSPKENVSENFTKIGGGWKVRCSSFNQGLYQCPAQSFPLYIYAFFFLFPFIIFYAAFTGLFLILTSSLIHSMILLLLFIWIPAVLAYILFKRLELSLSYIWPLIFGFLGGLYGYYHVEDKKLGKKLLVLGVIGLLVGTIFFIFLLEASGSMIC